MYYWSLQCYEILPRIYVFYHMDAHTCIRIGYRCLAARGDDDGRCGLLRDWGDVDDECDRSCWGGKVLSGGSCSCRGVCGTLRCFVSSIAARSVPVAVCSSSCGRGFYCGRGYGTLG